VRQSTHVDSMIRSPDWAKHPLSPAEQVGS
jgi:hypothetical protein